MKYLLITLLSLFVGISSFAQDEREVEDEEKGKFRRDNIFLGGSLNIGFGGGGFTLGANPMIGYSITNWLDAGITTNLIYSSQRLFESGREFRQRSFNYGGGPFIRVYPINSIHLQAQYEYNWIRGNVEDVLTSQKYKASIKAPSLLVGAGYGTRIIGQSITYLTILFDITQHENSPYIYTQGFSKVAIPVVRVGFNIYLKPKRR